MNLLESFYKLPQSLCECDGYVSKTTGEYIELTWAYKIVYTYMLSRNEFFTGKLKGKHYEAQQTIADKCNMDYRTVGNILRSFMDNGVIRGNKVKPPVGQWRWNYHYVDENLDLWKYKTDNEGKKVKFKGNYIMMGDATITEQPQVQDEPVPDYSEYCINYEEPEFDGPF